MGLSSVREIPNLPTFQSFLTFLANSKIVINLWKILPCFTLRNINLNRVQIVFVGFYGVELTSKIALIGMDRLR